MKVLCMCMTLLTSHRVLNAITMRERAKSWRFKIVAATATETSTTIIQYYILTRIISNRMESYRLSIALLNNTHTHTHAVLTKQQENVVKWIGEERSGEWNDGCMRVKYVERKTELWKSGNVVYNNIRGRSMLCIQYIRTHSVISHAFKNKRECEHLYGFRMLLEFLTCIWLTFTTS